MRRDGILLFINVALGLCLGAGVATLVAQLQNVSPGIEPEQLNSQYVILISLFIIYFANLLRTFLGFVKFYQDESLYDADYEKLVDINKLCIVRLGDFLAMMLIVLSLIFQGLLLHHYRAFSILFFISSAMFVIRNGVLHWVFNKLETSSSKLHTEIERIELRGTNQVVRRWLIIDILFLFPAILLFFGISPTEFQQFLFGIDACLLLILSGGDIWSSRMYYFGSALHEGASPA